MTTVIDQLVDQNNLWSNKTTAAAIRLSPKFILIINTAANQLNERRSLYSVCGLHGNACLVFMNYRAHVCIHA